MLLYLKLWQSRKRDEVGRISWANASGRGRAMLSLGSQHVLGHPGSPASRADHRGRDALSSSIPNSMAARCGRRRVARGGPRMLLHDNMAA